MSANRSRRSTRSVVLIILGVIGAIAVVIAVALGGGDSGDGSGSTAAQETGPVSVGGDPLLVFEGNGRSDAAVGATMPTLTGESFDGSPVTVGPERKPQMLVFLAHYCPHCQAEVPRVVDLADDGAFRGVGVTGITTGTNPAYPNYPPSAWLEREGWPFPVLADSPGQAAARAYGLTQYPFFVFVAADGTVAGRATGEIATDDLDAIVSALRDGEELPLPGGTGAATER